MAKEKNTTVIEKDDETTLSKRVTRLESLVRKLMSKAEIHWGEDIDKDGKVGSMRIGLMVLIVVGFVGFSFAESNIVDWTAGATSLTGRTAKIEDDGTKAVLTIDKINVQNATVIGGATLVVTNDLQVQKNSTVIGNSTVTGNVTVVGTAGITGLATLNNILVRTNAIVNGDSTVVGNSTVTGNVTVVGTAGITGLATLNNITVRTNAVINGAATVVGNCTVTGTVSGVAGSLVKGRAAVSAPSTSYYMIESGSTSASGHDGATTITQAFTTVFTSVPVVLWNYTGTVTNEGAPKVATVATNQFILQAQTNITWAAIGLKSN